MNCTVTVSSEARATRVAASLREVGGLVREVLMPLKLSEAVRGLCNFFGYVKNALQLRFSPQTPNRSGYGVPMTYRLAFSALPAASAQQRARCARTGRFVAWAVASVSYTHLTLPTIYSV